jgi:hypothetical protein
MIIIKDEKEKLVEELDKKIQSPLKKKRLHSKKSKRKRKSSGISKYKLGNRL